MHELLRIDDSRSLYSKRERDLFDKAFEICLQENEISLDEVELKQLDSLPSSQEAFKALLVPITGAILGGLHSEDLQTLIEVLGEKPELASKFVINTNDTKTEQKEEILQKQQLYNQLRELGVIVGSDELTPFQIVERMLGIAGSR